MANKGTGIYRKGRELSYNDVKQQVRQWTGWSEAQYKKNYDILRNKLRTYETFSGEKEQSPSAVLYRWQKAKATNPNYKESPAMERLLSFPSYSSGQAKKKLESQRVETRLGNIYSASTERAFEGLIANNAKAAEIAQNVTDPIMREKALADFADKMHQATRANQNRAISQSFGSDVYADFDYSNYLTKE